MQQRSPSPCSSPAPSPSPSACPQAMEKLQRRAERLHADLEATTDRDEIARLGGDLASVQREISELEDRWLELSVDPDS